jgi:predicted signal transduction protein with EAL and GGDEF domain
VRPGDVVARLGGDEFAILQTDVRDSEMLHHLAGRIEAALSVPVMLENEQVFPRASIGMALCPSDAIEAGALLRAADHALYQAKRSGGGRSILASGGTRASLLSTPGQDLETDLRIALAAEELQVHWQPYVNASTGVVRGFEALARWHRPGHGQVAPNVFVPFAEATGLIARLDTWMLEAACRQAASWPSPVQISVNLSAHWFGGPDLIPLIERTAGKTGMPLSRLCIEVTERTLIAAKHIAREQIDALAALGVRVGLDDFGVGFSSLGYLRELPFDTLKLDRSFITSLGRDVRSEQVAGAIIKLGHLLGMTVCAEGVETTTQLQCLKRQGCDLVQGFLFGSPSSTPDFTPRDVVRAVVGRKRFPPQDRPKTITSEKAAEFADD